MVSKVLAQAYKSYKELSKLQVNNVKINEAPNSKLTVDDFDTHTKTYDAPEFMDGA